MRAQALISAKQVIAPNIIEMDIQVVPNPACNIFTIQSEFDLFPINGQTQVKIYSLSGTLLLGTKTATEQNVGVSNLPTGV